MYLNQPLKVGHDVLMPTSSRGTLGGCNCRQTIYQNVDQLLLQPVRGIGVEKCPRPTFGHADGGRVKLVQMPDVRRRGQPTVYAGWDGERDSG